jgi:hypothetical protein
MTAAFAGLALLSMTAMAAALGGLVVGAAAAVLL